MIQLIRPLKGNRKYAGFLLALFLYTALNVIAMFRISESRMDLPAYAFQLAAGISVICGLFFGSNVLEHFSAKEKEENK